MEKCLWLLPAALATSSPCNGAVVRIEVPCIEVRVPTDQWSDQENLKEFMEGALSGHSEPSSADHIVQSLGKLAKPPSGDEITTLRCWLEGEHDREAAQPELVKFPPKLTCEAGETTTLLRASVALTLEGPTGFVDFLGRARLREKLKDQVGESKLYLISRTEQDDGAVVDLTRIDTKMPGKKKLLEYHVGNYDDILKQKKDEAEKIRLTVSWVTQIPETKLPDQASLQSFVDELGKGFLKDLEEAFEDGGSAAQKMYERFASAVTQGSDEDKEQSVTLTWTGIYDANDNQSEFTVRLMCRARDWIVTAQIRLMYKLTNSHAPGTSPLLAFLGDLWAQEYSPEPDSALGNVKLYRIKQPDGSKTDFTRVVKQLAGNPGKEVIKYHVASLNEPSSESQNGGLWKSSARSSSRASFLLNSRCSTGRQIMTASPLRQKLGHLVGKAFLRCCPFFVGRHRHANLPVAGQVNRSRARGRQVVKRSKTGEKESQKKKCKKSSAKRRLERRAVRGKKAAGAAAAKL